MTELFVAYSKTHDFVAPAFLLVAGITDICLCISATMWVAKDFMKARMDYVNWKGKRVKQ